MTNIDDCHNMIFWSQAKPPLYVWIVGCISRSPHTSQSHLFSSQQHILDGSSSGSNVFYVNHIVLLGAFRCDNEQYRGAQWFGPFLANDGLRLFARYVGHTRRQTCCHDFAQFVARFPCQDKKSPRLYFMMVRGVRRRFQHVLNLLACRRLVSHFADATPLFDRLEYNIALLFSTHYLISLFL